MGETVTIETVVAIVVSLGGFEAVKWLVTYIINRKSLKQQAHAEATHADLTNLNDYADSWKELYMEAKGEVKEKDAKIDSLYIDIKKLRECKAEHGRNEHRLELENESMKRKKCDVIGCAHRVPPSDY